MQKPIVLEFSRPQMPPERMAVAVSRTVPRELGLCGLADPPRTSPSVRPPHSADSTGNTWVKPDSPPENASGGRQLMECGSVWENANGNRETPELRSEEADLGNSTVQLLFNANAASETGQLREGSIRMTDSSRAKASRTLEVLCGTPTLP